MAENPAVDPESNGDVAFSDAALAEFRGILTHYPERRAALMSTLWLAQREFEWLSPAVQRYVAELLELPIAWVESVVSFYTMYYRRPMGRHHIQLCTNLSCYLRGSDDILTALLARLDIGCGQTTRDGLYSVDRAECLGSCGTAPMMQLNDRYLENLTVDEVMQLLDRLDRGEEV